MEFINAMDLPASGAMSENHGIIVLQDGKLRYMSLAEFQNYMASASIEVDPTLTVGGVAADAAATGLAIRNAAPHNYLDNSDFANPVNQRGATSYSGNGYTIDRWRITNNYASMTVDDDGVTFTASGGIAYPMQYVPVTEEMMGKTFTAAVCLKDGTIHVFGGGVLESFDESQNLAIGSKATIDDGTVLALYAAKVGHIMFQMEVADGASLAVKWAALYEGEYTADNLPVYQPKGYTAELLECKRYYLEGVGSYCSGYATSNGCNFAIDIPVAMRTNPTATILTNDNVVWPGGMSTLKAITQAANEEHCVVIVATLNSPPSSTTVCATAGIRLSLSADL